jgi:hypothetical protein
MERPGVLLENGHVTHFSFAVLDVPKEQQHGNDTHGSKIIVVPFDGAALDRDLQDHSPAARTGATSLQPGSPCEHDGPQVPQVEKLYLGNVNELSQRR